MLNRLSPGPGRSELPNLLPHKAFEATGLLDGCLMAGRIAPLPDSARFRMRTPVGNFDLTLTLTPPPPPAPSPPTG